MLMTMTMAVTMTKTETKAVSLLYISDGAMNNKWFRPNEARPSFKNCVGKIVYKNIVQGTSIFDLI